MNKLNRITLITTMISSLFFASCVSLKTPERTDLVELKSPMLIGKYPFRASRTFQTNAQQDTVVSIPIWYFFKDSEGADSAELAKATHMEVSLTDKNHVTTTLYSGSTLLKSEVIKGRIKNGYFRKKHSLSIKGVPPFYWSMSSTKMQFGLNNKGELYIDQADETSGSILIIVAGTPGFTTSFTVAPYLK
jgi:hypothetical protein